MRISTSAVLIGRRRLVAGFVAIGLLAGCGTGASSENPGDEPTTGFFADETITIMVPFGAGGANDITARFIADHLPKFLEGEPTITVKNVPGGGGLVGWNQYENSVEKDGLTLMMGSATPHSMYAYGAEGVQFDLSTKVPLLATMIGTIMYGSADLGVEDASQLLDPGVPELHIGGLTPNGNSLLKVMPLHVLDADFQVTWGYESAAAHRVAFQQGETNIDSQTAPLYTAQIEPNLEAEGSVPLLTIGQVEGSELVRDPKFPDLPHVGEVYEEIHGEAPEGPLWEAYKVMVAMGHALGVAIWVHGDAPDGAVQELQQAMSDLKEDPDFLADAADVLGGYPLLVGEELEKLVDLYLLNPDEEAIDYLIEFVKDEYDVELDGPAA